MGVHGLLPWVNSGPMRNEGSSNSSRYGGSGTLADRGSRGQRERRRQRISSLTGFFVVVDEGGHAVRRILR